MQPKVIIMRVIAAIGAGLALLAGVVVADAQGIGAAPGVNPSNPQDLSNRSNPQDLSGPGGSNRQDLVRQPPRVNVPAVTSPSHTYARGYTSKPKQNARYRGFAARR